MRESSSKLIAASVHFCSIAVTFYSMFRAAGGELGGGALLFGLWATSPYLFVVFVQSLTGKIKALPKIPYVFAFLSLIMLGFTVFAYIFAMDGTSSTEALVYVFVPVYLYIGAALVLALGFAGSFLLNRSRVN